MRLSKSIAMICLASSIIASATEAQKQGKTDYKKYSIGGVLWSAGKTKVSARKLNYLEYVFSKSGFPKKFRAIGPFICGEDSVLGIEYNLEVQHEKPFILNFKQWNQRILKVEGVIFDAGLTSDRSIYWLLEGCEAGKGVDTFVLLYSKNGEQLLRERVSKPGNMTLTFGGRKFEVNVRLARGIDLIN